MKRAIAIFVVLFVAVVVAAALFMRRAGGTGSTSIEQWVGSQLQSIANAYLNPQMSFDDLDYKYPGTVTLKNLKLVADDPTTGGKISILSAASATVALAEIPQVGKPIVIERISLKQPSVSVIFDPAARSFVGFTHLIRRENVEVQAPSSQPAHHLPKLSDLFKIKLVEFIDGKITYDPRIAGTDAMELDQINTVLNIEPDTAGLYKLNCRIARERIFEFLIDGRLDLDHFEAMDVHAKLDASLSEEKLSFLPPQLQKLARQYEVKGSLSLDLKGSVPVFHPLQGEANVKLSVTDANVSAGNYRIPVDSLSLSADFKDACANVRELKIKALDGEADVVAMMMINKDLDLAVRIDIADMLVQRLLSSKASGEATQLKGRITAHVEATAPAAVVMAKWKSHGASPLNIRANEPLRADWGRGHVKITQANLAVFPVVKQLNATIREVTGLLGGGEPNDRLDVDAVFSQDRVEITELSFVTNSIAAHGSGFIGLNHSLDLLLNGGPIEKLQGMLGYVGAVIGKFTDSLAHYRVSGTLGNPVVSIEVGEKAVDTAKNVGEKTVDGVGEGIENIGKGLEGIFGK